MVDLDRFRMVLFDQRNCGRSTPSASDPSTDLRLNTTWELVEDIERLRKALGIERWVVLGGSWGSNLGLAYAEAHPGRVSGLVLFGVGLGRKAEIDWLFRGGLSKFFPAEWAELCDSLVCESSGVSETLYSRLNSAEASIRQAAANAWCLWESATPSWPPTRGLSGRFQDPEFALTFARLVNHFVRHDFWLEDDQLLRNAGRLAEIPGVLINGRFDFQSPLDNAWDLHRAWPRSELVVVENAGHSIDGAMAGGD